MSAKNKFCCVVGCGKAVTRLNSSKLPNRSKKRFEEWIKLIGRPDVAFSNPDKLRVCGDHFVWIQTIHGRRHLETPSLKLPAQNATSIFFDATSTLTKQTPSEQSEQEEELVTHETDILELENEIATILDSTNTKKTSETFASFAEETNLEILALENEIAAIITSSNTMKKKLKSEETIPILKRKFNKWQDMLKNVYQKQTYLRKRKLFCLNLYYSAPKAYKLFARYFSLPSPISLQNTKLIFNSGINKSLSILLLKQLNALKMPFEAKKVMLCLDELPITKKMYYDITQDEVLGYIDINGKKKFTIAENALILRIKSLFYEFEQTFAYGLIGAFGSDDCAYITSWLDDTVKFLHKKGLTVCAIAVNQTQNMSRLALSYGVTVKRPYATIHGKRIFFILDIPQLIFSIRDTLLDNDLIYGDNKMASWQHVKSFYEKDCERKLRLAPNLSFAHIKPGRSQRKQLKLLKQVFSYTVAAAISADVEVCLQSPEAAATAEFLMGMNNLYDLLNTTNEMKKGQNKYKNAFIGEKYQIELLLNTCAMLKNIKVVNSSTGKSTGETHCFLGMLMTIRAILQLKQEYDIKTLFTKRLHLNTSKLFFNINKCLMGNRNTTDVQMNRMGMRNIQMLTAVQFRRCFTKLVLKDLMKNSYLLDCPKDIDSMIFGDQSVRNEFTVLEEYFPNVTNLSSIAVGTKDYRFQMPPRGMFEFVSSYLLYKCSKKHKCDGLEAYVRDNRKLIPSDRSRHVMKSQILNYVVPPQEFVNYVHELENWFIINTNTKRLMKEKLVSGLLKDLLSKKNAPVLLSAPCLCFPMEYMLKLFLRMRIYNSIKFRNQNIRIKNIQMRGTSS